MEESRITSHYFNEEAGSDAVSGWGPKVFDILTVEPTASATTGRRECALLCRVEGNPCNGFVYIAPLCYLTNFNVNSSLANSVTGTHSWYTRLCK